MVLPLPNLDDRRWVDLVEEGRSLIPFYAPTWTDHNIHDPGITIMELFAWIAESDIYQLNRIPRERKRKFLALIGLQPFPPRASQTVLRFTLQSGSLELPAFVEFEGDDLRGQRTRFRTLMAVTVIANQLEAIQVKDETGFHDLTARWRRSQEIQLLGENPGAGTTIYLGFAQELPCRKPISLFFAFGDLPVMAEEEERLRLEIKQAEAACHPRLKSCCKVHQRQHEQPAQTEETAPLSHHSVRLVWEFLTTSGKWRRLEASEDQIRDETRAFTLNGRVVLKVPGQMTSGKVGTNISELYYLRCRVVGGAYDAAPLLKSIALNAVAAEQAVSLTTQIEIAENVVAETEEGATLPNAGNLSSFLFEMEKGEISWIRFVKPGSDRPVFRVLEFTAATNSAKGHLSFEAAALGVGDGKPSQRLVVPQHPVVAPSFQLFTLQNRSWQRWLLHADLDGSDRIAQHFMLDAEEGTVEFGDGEKGRVPPVGALVFATGYQTRAEQGNLQIAAVNKLTDSLHNRTLLDDFDQVKNKLVGIANPLPATGGDDAETLEEASERALELIEKPNRAVTLGDYEALARETPGVRLARISARANLHPGFPCFSAPGIITVIILPSLPAKKPSPSFALRQRVAAYLMRRRVIGTRVEVVGPTYRQISVLAQVQSSAGVDSNKLKQRLTARLDRFFDPLAGGPDGNGWPFGRDVYRSEVLQLIDETQGVENVISLELTSGNGKPQCGNICIGPTGLVDAGQHEIAVV